MSWGYNGKTDTPWQPKPGLVSKRRVTRQDADEMARLRRSGLTTEAIGSMFRVNRGTVEYHLKRLLTDREREQISLDCRRRGKQRQAKVERNAQIIELRRQGKSIREVALAFGVSTRVVAGILLRLLPIEETEALALRKNWSHDDPSVVQALALRRSGMAIRTAARQAGISSSSLHRLIKKCNTR